MLTVDPCRQRPEKGILTQNNRGGGGVPAGVQTLRTEHDNRSHPAKAADSGGMSPSQQGALCPSTNSIYETGSKYSP